MVLGIAIRIFGDARSSAPGKGADRHRHCPKCQGAAARTWLATREADLLPVGYFHVVFTLPAEIGAIAFHNKALLYDLLFKAASETMLIIAADPKHLADRRAFLRHVSPVRNKRWVVYAKPPFAGPEAVLAYLARYTHRVAISNRRLIAFDEGGVTFRYKDYRRSGADRQQVMTLAGDEFIRRFLLHNLPRGFHRIRHYGLLAGSTRKAHLERARQLLAVAPPAADEMPIEPPDARPLCPCCGGRMIVIEIFERRYQPRGPPANITVSGSPAS